MPQFLIKSSEITDNKFTLKGEDYYHLTKVRRAKEGDIIDLRSEDGILYEGKIIAIAEGYLTLEILKKHHADSFELSLSLYISLLKGKKFDLVLQKATEIGVSRIIPVSAERSIPDLSGKENKKIRWDKIVAEAFKQCMRKQIPVVEKLISFKEAVLDSSTAVKIIAHPDKSGKRIYEYLTSLNEKREISILIGPEGGFSDKELAFAKENGWDQVVFGFTSLRAETAAIVLPAIIIYEMNKPYKS
jgi:16S rRNA (uracil1498-N3)-methyltransferase